MPSFRTESEEFDGDAWQHRAAPDTPPDTYEPGNPNRQRDWTVLHRDHLWRIYDYPHIINMYYRLYQIGKFYPGMLKWKTSAQYLELAYHTTVAYWTVPFATRNWSANSVGTMNEACIEDLIYALERLSPPMRFATRASTTWIRQRSLLVQAARNPEVQLCHTGSGQEISKFPDVAQHK